MLFKLVVRMTVGTLALAWVSVLPARGDCRGPGDLTGDGSVDLSDYGVFAGCMGGVDVVTPPPACDPTDFAAADLDEDSDVDLGDFALFAATFGANWFPYGPSRDNLEAEMLAMDVSGQLRAPDGEYTRIRGDLILIRTAYPQLTSVVDDTDYVPDQLIVGLEAGSPTDGYEALNERYLVIDELIYTWGRLLTFCDNLNAPVLAQEYQKLAEVSWADPNWLIGIDDYITVTPMGGTYRYDIDDGFMDCFDGCDCHRYWVIDVDEYGVVTLISYVEQGLPWCNFDSTKDEDSPTSD